jgi:hypothetical protein
MILSKLILGRRYRQCFLLDKSCRKMYTIFSAVLRQQRKSDAMTYFVTQLAAPSIIKHVRHPT